MLNCIHIVLLYLIILFRLLNNIYICYSVIHLQFMFKIIFLLIEIVF